MATDRKSPVIEKRVFERLGANIQARLTKDALSVTCTIIDISPTGARLQVAQGVTLPKFLSLHAEELGGDRIVEIVWRNKTQLGVRF